MSEEEKKLCNYAKKVRSLLWKIDIDGWGDAEYNVEHRANGCAKTKNTASMQRANGCTKFKDML